MPNPIALQIAKPPTTPIQHPASEPQHQLLPLVKRARFLRHHRWLAYSLFLFVFCPLMLAAWYLYTRAADQYTSSVGFAVRAEKASSGLDLLGGISGLSAFSSTSSSDTDILYEFLFSQALVAKVDQKIDLANIWSNPKNDFVFSYNPHGTIEDLTKYWRRMLRVSYDPGTGLIALRAHAFAPKDAQEIAIAVLEESSAMINRLSSIARADTMRYAKDELTHASAQLEQARKKLMDFRAKTHIVDPIADLQGEMGVLSRLQQKLAEELIILDMLRSTARNISGAARNNNQTSDVRITQAEMIVQVIRDRITDEREKIGGGGGRDYSALVGEFERLNVDLEFAQQSYVSALATLESSRAEAQRQNRYLAAYVAPTLAEQALYPKREQLIVMLALFLGLGWAVFALVFYNLRDRR